MGYARSCIVVYDLRGHLVRVLVNCAHLANIRKQEHFRVINLRLGLHTPAIITPLVLLPEESDYENL